MASAFEAHQRGLFNATPEREASLKDIVMSAEGRPGDPMSLTFPFTHIQGQDDLKLALLLNAVDPTLGGILIRGPGNRKSTSARALAELMPNQVFVNLPLGATEELVVAPRPEQSARRSNRGIQPRLVGQGPQGILYVDEVNLLPASLVDILLDVASSGVNIVERDGISHRHPAQLSLVGTMNPDEGEVRPQLLDRFALCVDLTGDFSPDERLAIIKTRLAFERDAGSICASADADLNKLRQRLVGARGQLAQVTYDDALLMHINQVCVSAGVEGVRADLAALKATLALSAWEGESSATLTHANRVLPWVLAHRAKSNEQPNSSSNAAVDSDTQSHADNGKGDWGEMAPVAVPVSDERFEVVDRPKP